MCRQGAHNTLIWGQGWLDALACDRPGALEGGCVQAVCWPWCLEPMCWNGTWALLGGGSKACSCDEDEFLPVSEWHLRSGCSDPGREEEECGVYPEVPCVHSLSVVL